MLNFIVDDKPYRIPDNETMGDFIIRVLIEPKLIVNLEIMHNNDSLYMYDLETKMSILDEMFPLNIFESVNQKQNNQKMLTYALSKNYNSLADYINRRDGKYDIDGKIYIIGLTDTLIQTWMTIGINKNIIIGDLKIYEYNLLENARKIMRKQLIKIDGELPKSIYKKYANNHYYMMSRVKKIIKHLNECVLEGWVSEFHKISTEYEITVSFDNNRWYPDEYMEELLENVLIKGTAQQLMYVKKNTRHFRELALKLDITELIKSHNNNLTHIKFIELIMDERHNTFDSLMEVILFIKGSSVMDVQKKGEIYIILGDLKNLKRVKGLKKNSCLLGVSAYYNDNNIMKYIIDKMKYTSKTKIPVVASTNYVEILEDHGYMPDDILQSIMQIWIEKNDKESIKKVIKYVNDDKKLMKILNILSTKPVSSDNDDMFYIIMRKMSVYSPKIIKHIIDNKKLITMYIQKNECSLEEVLYEGHNVNLNTFLEIAKVDKSTLLRHIEKITLKDMYNIDSKYIIECINDNISLFLCYKLFVVLPDIDILMNREYPDQLIIDVLKKVINNINKVDLLLDKYKSHTAIIDAIIIFCKINIIPVDVLCIIMKYDIPLTKLAIEYYINMDKQKFLQVWSHEKMDKYHFCGIIGDNLNNSENKLNKIIQLYISNTGIRQKLVDEYPWKSDIYNGIVID